MLREMYFNNELPKQLQYCNVGAAVIGSAVVGAGAQMFGASEASNAQQAAAQAAGRTSMRMYNRTRMDLRPFRKLGYQAEQDLMPRLDYLTSPIRMDEQTLRQTPGYQFNLTQGLKSVQNSAAARGLGVSGAALKGASAFATGLADNTYQNQFNNENINRTNAYNRLKGLIDTGESAAAQTGAAGTQAANTTAQAQMAAGNAAAAGYNAIGSAVSNAANNIGGYAAYKGIYGNSGVNYAPDDI